MTPCVEEKASLSPLCQCSWGKECQPLCLARGQGRAPEEPQNKFPILSVPSSSPLLLQGLRLLTSCFKLCLRCDFGARGSRSGSGLSAVPCWQHRAQAALGHFCLLWAAAAGVCLHLSLGLGSTAGTGSAWSKSSANGKMQLLPQAQPEPAGPGQPKATRTSLEVCSEWEQLC